MDKRISVTNTKQKYDYVFTDTKTGEQAFFDIYKDKNKTLLVFPIAKFPHYMIMKTAKAYFKKSEKDIVNVPGLTRKNLLWYDQKLVPASNVTVVYLR